MYKLTFTILSFIVSLTLYCQTQIPNSNFEDWSIAENGSDSLIGWSSSNTVTIYPVKSLYKETDSYEGKYAANLDTAPFGFVGYTTQGILVNGQAIFSYGGGGGGANVEYVSGGGTPISFKPTSLKGHYKYSTLNPPDRGLGYVYLTKFNSVLNKRDTVSYGHYTFNEVGEYTDFTIDLPDLKPGIIPDTITVLFYSSDLSIVPPTDVFSNLFLDAISLFPEIVSTEEPKENDFSIFPNPCTDHFKVKIKNEKTDRIDIYNSIGQKVKSITFSSEVKEVDVNSDDLEAGVYLITNKGQINKKLIIVK